MVNMENVLILEGYQGSWGIVRPDACVVNLPKSRMKGAWPIGKLIAKKKTRQLGATVSRPVGLRI